MACSSTPTSLCSLDPFLLWWAMVEMRKTERSSSLVSGCCRGPYCVMSLCLRPSLGALDVPCVAGIYAVWIDGDGRKEAILAFVLDEQMEGWWTDRWRMAREMETRLDGMGCSHLEVSDHPAWSSGTLAASEKAQQCHS